MVLILYIKKKQKTINYSIIKNLVEVNIYHLNTLKNNLVLLDFVWTNKWLVTLSIVAFWFHPQMHCHTVHFLETTIFLGGTKKVL